MRQLLPFLEVSGQAMARRIPIFQYNLRLNFVILYIQFSTIISLPTLSVSLLLIYLYDFSTRLSKSQKTIVVS